MGVGRCDNKKSSGAIEFRFVPGASYGNGFLSKDNDKTALSFARFLELAPASYGSNLLLTCT